MRYPLVPAYRRRSSALHQAKPAAVLFYILGLTAFVFAVTQPVLLLIALLLAIVISLISGAYRDMGLFWPSAAAMVVVVTLINPLVAHDGNTVLVYGPVLPVFGALDITMEALIYGALMGLRLATAVILAGLFTVAVDPDGLLALFRRVGFRSALTASLATRMTQVLARDAVSISQAQACRARSGGRWRDRVGEKAKLLQALLTGSLERGVDVAVALEAKGFGCGRSNISGASWRGLDWLFLGSGLALLAASLYAAVSGTGVMAIYPGIGSAYSTAVAGVAMAVTVITLIPFAGRAR